MTRDVVAAVVLSGVLAVGVACSGSEGDRGGSSCPDGLTRSESSSGASGPGASTREEAVRAELDGLEMAASDEAIAAGVVASAPGESAGTEELIVDTDQEVEITMFLAPLDPGWAVQRSTWCDPI
ncbi:MAG: hypothetical protein H0W97_05875 [Actinobacteria bacterium]|nr:hypothetical protein [Actinomycetota bacterium]